MVVGQSGPGFWPNSRSMDQNGPVHTKPALYLSGSKVSKQGSGPLVVESGRVESSCLSLLLFNLPCFVELCRALLCFFQKKCEGPCYFLARVGPKISKQGPGPSPSYLSFILLNLVCFVVLGRVVL